MIQQRRFHPVRASLAAVALTAAALFPCHVPAADGVRAAVRVVRGLRAGPPWVDPRLEDVRKQVSALAFQRWEQVSEQTPTLTQGSATFVELPDGSHVALSIIEVRGNIVTVEIALAQKNTQSRVTIEKGQRIVHQVAKERNGVALFVTVRPLP
jgi:hypothetical protein